MLVWLKFSTTKNLLQQHLTTVNHNNPDYPPIKIHQSLLPSVVYTSVTTFPPLTFDPTTGTLKPSLWCKAPFPSHNNLTINNNNPTSHQTYAQIAQPSSPPTSTSTEFQLLCQENSAICKQIELLKSTSKLQPSPSSNLSPT